MVELALERGNYLALVKNSEVDRFEDKAMLHLRLFVYRNGKFVDSPCTAFRIHHPNRELERRERTRLQDLAEAMGVELLEDSDQLLNRPFKLTVWRSDSDRWTCRPLADGAVGVGDEMASGKGMHPLAHHVEGDGDGPHAA